jgi:hypothetical protein
MTIHYVDESMILHDFPNTALVFEQMEFVGWKLSNYIRYKTCIVCFVARNAARMITETNLLLIPRSQNSDVDDDEYCNFVDDSRRTIIISNGFER